MRNEAILISTAHRTDGWARLAVVAAFVGVVWLVAACPETPAGPVPRTDAGVSLRPPDAGRATDSGRLADAGLDCSMAREGTSCGGVSICIAGECVASRCGDGHVDPANGEDCEDRNVVPGDGCEPSCQFTCVDNAGCNDGNVCTGDEICQADHTCTTPPDLGCDDTNACTGDSCDPVDGCSHVLIDGDGDGFAPESLGACGGGTRGGDCADTDATVYPGAPDGCGGGEGVNNDCDSRTDEDATASWYVDCDRDGFAPSTAGAVMTCDMPGASPTSCAGGSWTNRLPAGTSQTDCNDRSVAVFPGAVEEDADGVDQNCDARDRCYIDADEDTYRTDQLTLTTDVACRSTEGHALTTARLEWTTPEARHLCCDQHGEMHRGATSYQTSSSVGVAGVTACPAGRRWDFNCDGDEDQQHTVTVSSCFWEPAGCSRGGDRDTAGWLTTGTAPACGSTAQTWADNCNSSCPGEPFCTACSWRTLSMRVQGCR